MNARILATATLAVVFTGILPAMAADSQLMSLVMPDARVIAGVNVEQAKGTQFGQYLLSLAQMHDQEMKDILAKTGFDPTRDVREVLIASNASTKNGIVLGRGTFDVARLIAAATEHEAKTEIYKGITIITDPKELSGLAFLDSTSFAAGDLANVRGAIDRLSSPAILPAELLVKVNQWSTTQDAWAISTVPTSTVKVPTGAPNIPGIGNNALQGIQSAAAGVKLGTIVVFKSEAQADTAPNAQALGDAVKLLANLATLQQNTDPVLKTLTQSLVVSAQGTTLSVSVSMPSQQLQDLVKPRTAAPAVRRSVRRM